MKIKLLICGLAAVMLSSCSTISYTAKTADVNSGLYNLTVADMDVAKDKVTKTVEWKWNPLSSVSLGEQKKTAEAELLKESNADVLVEPRYEVVRRGFMRGGTLTVTGYPATYRNFRPMSQSDAEVVATAEGRIGLACYPINTSANKPKKKKKVEPLFKPKNEFNGRSFAALVGGATFVVSNDEFDPGVQLGAMYGRYGKKWGWYGKLLWANYVFCPDRGDEETKNGVTFTVGAIKTISRNVNFLFGTGIARGYAQVYDYSPHYGDMYNARVTTYLPVELGFQWSSRKITVLAGATLQIALGPRSGGFVNPFLGIGYNF